MFTMIGCACAVLVLLPILVICLFGMLVCKIIDFYQYIKVKQRAHKRRIQLDALIKEEHEWWLKLNEPDKPLTKEQLEHYASECLRLRNKIKRIARGEIPVLNYDDFPKLTKENYFFKNTSSDYENNPQLVLAETF